MQIFRPHYFVLLVAGLSSSCISHHVSPYLDYAPQPGFTGVVSSNTSIVIFSRPDDIRALSALLFDGEKFLTIMTELTYFVYETSPGSHHFVLRIGRGRLSFMDAELAPQKIYFAAVKYAEANTAWFELVPIVPNTDYWKDLPQWLSQSKEVRPNTLAFKWYDSRRSALLAEQDANEAKARRHQMVETYGVDRAPYAE
jgi:hypothetical protein